MYNVLRTEDFNTYKVRHFLVDSTSDLPSIISNFQGELHGGWSATVASSDGTKAYILKNDLTNWVESATPIVILM